MKKENEKETILVIGDCFIDENWKVSNTHKEAPFHYLMEKETNLCGVREFLEFLTSPNFDDSDKYSFVGCGIWGDDYESNESNKFKLLNLAEGQEKTTSRIIRCYEGHEKGEPNLLHRYDDWKYQSSNSKSDKLKLDKLDKLKGYVNSNISIIIIEDHNKGVIDSGTIKKLVDMIPSDKDKKIKCYIRSKIYNPKWMCELDEEKIEVRLNVIDYKLIKEKRQWIFGKKLGRASLEILGVLTGDDKYSQEKSNYKAQKAAVFMDDNTAIAKDGDDCFNLYKSCGKKELINIGRTTMFFNALIVQDILNGKESFEVQCYKALECAFKWSQDASKDWEEGNCHLYGKLTEKCLDKKQNGGEEEDNGDKEGKKSKKEAPSYDTLWEEWKASATELGIIDKKDKIFQVWRGESILKKYICVDAKRKEINELISKIDQEFFAKKEPHLPFNCLLVSGPGWGKSFLAKCMAEHFKMHYLEFSFAQMATAKDLVNCFDTICSVQNGAQKKVLVFMDEINCEIEGHSAMGLLLGPIWDGSFIRDGKSYRLSPATWIFASTDPTDDLIKLNKGSDFVSRLNGPIIQLDQLLLKNIRKKLIENPSIDPLQDEACKLAIEVKASFKTEQVYLGISLLNTLWGPIKIVKKGVLQLFHDMLLINGFRSLEFFVSKFQKMKPGKVSCSNLPDFEKSKELKRHVVLPENWKDKYKDKENNEDKENKENNENITIEQLPVSHR